MNNTIKSFLIVGILGLVGSGCVQVDSLPDPSICNSWVEDEDGFTCTDETEEEIDVNGLKTKKKGMYMSKDGSYFSTKTAAAASGFSRGASSG